MRAIAKINESDRKDLFINTATQKGLTEAIIEKDYWVCFMLDYLFHRSKWKNSIAFKGGTSLSKSYNLIKRFSESYNEEAGAHFTSRDIIYLMTDLLLAEEKDALIQDGVMKTVYDMATSQMLGCM